MRKVIYLIFIMKLFQLILNHYIMKLFIDDCSTDNSKIFEGYFRNKNIKYLSHKENLGQSSAIYTGIKNSKFDNIITIDADGQNNLKI